MTVRDLMTSKIGRVIHAGNNLDKRIEHPFCCDLLSLALSKAGANCVWVTVMGNVNTLAVASLTEISCIVLAEGVSLDEAAMDKVKTMDICVIGSNLSIFDTALSIYNMIHG